ncbi:metal ABC transporter substrate-binding protein [bacterium]|nr:metal ABC transporter substrate-binding protein [bacterium]
MKRFTVALVTTLVLLAGCTAPKEKGSDSETLVVASFHPVQQLAGYLLHDLPGFDVRSVAPASAGCPHHYTMTPADLGLIRKASLVIGQGYEMDAFLFTDEIRRSNPTAHFIDLSLSDPHPFEMSDEEHVHAHMGDDHQPATTPHVWVSPLRVARHTALLTDSLAYIFPAYRDSITQRGERLEASLLDLHQRFTASVEASSNRHIASMHTSFDILAQDIGLEMDLVVQVDPVASPGPRTLERITRELKEGRISILLSEPQMEGALENSLAERAGVELIRLNTGVGTDSELDLLAMHEENLLTLSRALQGEK